MAAKVKSLIYNYGIELCYLLFISPNYYYCCCCFSVKGYGLWKNFSFDLYYKQLYYYC